MATVNEYLVERIAALELELSEAKALYDDLVEHHEETVNYFERLVAEHDLLRKYLKPEKHLVTCIIDGEDAIKVANMFNLRLSPIKE